MKSLEETCYMPDRYNGNSLVSWLTESSGRFAAAPLKLGVKCKRNLQSSPSPLFSSLQSSRVLFRRKRIKAKKPIPADPSDPVRCFAMVSLQFWAWIGWIGLCVPALGKSGKGSKGGKQLKISYRFAQLTDVHIEPFYNPELLS